MAESLGVAVLDLDVDTSKMQRGMADAKTTANKAGSSISTSLGAGIRKAALPAAAALGLVALGAKKTIDAASNLGEQVNKTTVIFGKSGQEIQTWSKGLAGSFGLSQRAALEAAGTYGNMLKPMGLAPALVKDMSKSMTELAGDMASFNNADPSETLDSLRAGLAGETEPLRRFGVFLNQDRIEMEALTSGLVKGAVSMASVKVAQNNVNTAVKEAQSVLKKSGKGSIEYADAVVQVEAAEAKATKALAGKVPKLTAAQKATATYNLIMKDTKDSQGDFANTATSAANASRVQAAETENLNSKIGQGLLPAYQALQQMMVKVTGFMSEHTTTVKVLVGAIAALAAGILIANGAMKVYKAAQIAIKAATVAWTAAQWLLNAALTANPIGVVVVALAALVGGLILAYQKSETFRAIVDKAFKVVKAAAEAVLNFFRNNWKIIATLISGPFAPIVFLATDAFGIRSKLIGAFTAIKNWVTSNWKVIATIISGPFAPIVALATDAFGIRSRLIGAFTAIKNWVTSNWKVIATIISGPFAPLVALATNAFGIRSAIFGAFEAMKTKIFNVIGIVVGWMAGLPGRIKGALGDLTNLLWSAGWSIITSLWNGMKNAWEKTKDWLGSLGGIARGIKGPPSKDAVLLYDIGQLIIRGLGDGMESEWSSIESKLGALSPKIQDQMTKLLNDARDSILSRRGILASALGEVASAALAAFDKMASDAETKSEKTLRLMEEKRSARARAQSIKDAKDALTAAESAKTALMQGEDETPQEFAERQKAATEAITAAKKQLDDALYEQEVFNLQKKAEQERKSLDDRTALRKRNFERDLVALQKYAENHKLTARQLNDKLIDLFGKYNIPFRNSGKKLGLALSDGLNDAMGSVSTAAQKLFAELKRQAENIKIVINVTVKGGKPDGKASGGPVYANDMYTVGERGMELFIPAVNGTVVPNHELSKYVGKFGDLSGVSHRTASGISSGLHRPGESHQDTRGRSTVHVENMTVRDDRDIDLIASRVAQKLAFA